MTDQDKVSLVHGTWVRDADNRWIFEPDILCVAEHYISLHVDMTMTELLTAVKERLDLTSKKVSIKLSYQYPEWIAMGDGDLDMPQFISDDLEVGVFIRMRRTIEEVDLYVSIVRQSDVGTTLLPNPLDEGEDEGENWFEEEEWHTFAISETPLTLPPTQKNNKGKEQEVPQSSVHNRLRSSRRSQTIPHIRGGIVTREPTGTIPHALGGIVIREPTGTIPRPSADLQATSKGKNKRIMEDIPDSDSDSDNAMVVPVLHNSIPQSVMVDRPVARRLLFGEPAIPNNEEGIGGSSSSTDPPDEVPDEFGQHWGRFDEALHEMLNDPFTPALFGKDAPPVFNNRRGTGKSSFKQTYYIE